MKKEELKKLILTAGGARKADTVIKNCKVVNVFSGKIVEGDIALCGDQIAGVGEYEGEVEIDAEGRYAAPGFIDSHIHIESSYLSPEELGRLLVPHGGTTIIADPHGYVQHNMRSKLFPLIPVNDHRSAFLHPLRPSACPE